MRSPKALSWKSYALTNGLIAFVFSNLLLFGGSLEMGEDFTAGLLADLGLGACGVSALLLAPRL